MKKQKMKRFRLSGKHLFLTYSQVVVERESVLEQLKEKLKPSLIEKYIISTENHKEKGEHVHCYIKTDRKVDIENANRLDIEDKEKKKVHGNYQTCRCFYNVSIYVIKEDREKILTNMKLDDLGRELSLWRDITKSSKEESVEEALEKVKEVAPKHYVMDYQRIKGNLIAMKRAEKSQELETYEIKDYEIPKEVGEWWEKEKNKKTLYLSGPSGIGKTEMMKSMLVKEYGEKEVLRVNNIEGLKKLNERDYKALILDDVNTEKMGIEELLGILDVKNKHDQRILYNTVEIKNKVPRAFITNKKINEWMGEKGIGGRQREAVLRRCKAVDLEGIKLRITKEKITVEVEI